MVYTVTDNENTIWGRGETALAAWEAARAAILETWDGERAEITDADMAGYTIRAEG